MIAAYPWFIIESARSAVGTKEMTYELAIYRIDMEKFQAKHDEAEADIAAGKEGADSVHRYVWGHSLTIGRMKRDIFHEIDKDNLVINAYDHGLRQVPGKEPTKVKSFSDERLTFTEEQMQAETARCLSCGAAKVDDKICIGCGICTTRCKFDAIHLSRTKDAWGATYEMLVPFVLKGMGKRVVDLSKKKLTGEFKKDLQK